MFLRGYVSVFDQERTGFATANKKQCYGSDDDEAVGYAQNYDLDVLYTLRANAALYVHGHSAGGTNPSLVEAMFFGRPILAYDVVYNRETTQGKAYYYRNSEDLKKLLEMPELDGSAMRRIAEKEYTWRHIAERYEENY